MSTGTLSIEHHKGKLRLYCYGLGETEFHTWIKYIHLLIPRNQRRFDIRYGLWILPARWEYLLISLWYDFQFGFVKVDGKIIDDERETYLKTLRTRRR